MQLIDPLDEDHWCVILLTVLEHRTNLADEAIKVKDHVLGRQAREHCILDLLVDLLGELLDFVIRASNQSDDVVEDRVELSALEDVRAVALGYIEYGVTCGDGDLWVLVNLQALCDWSNHVFEELGNGLLQ